MIIFSTWVVRMYELGDESLFISVGDVINTMLISGLIRLLLMNYDVYNL